MRTSNRFSVTATLAVAGGTSSLFLIALAGIALASGSGSAVIAIVAISVLGLLINISCFMFISRRIVRPLREAIADGRSLVKGDLRSAGGTSATGELGELQAVYRDLRDVLVNIVRDVRSDAISIDTTAMTLNKDNQALSQRSKAQAASIKETAASVETLASTTAQSAETSERVSELVGTACDNAVKGNEVVQSVAATMDAIRTSSQKIADIVGVIDGIAFQTNILALNAAVEAARAGEQGRGFAVVASEVRHLAQRSAQEAKDIKALIGEAVKNVEEGSQLVAVAGQTMNEIVSSVGSVSGHMKDIATASREQSQSIQRINKAVVQFESMTAENQALAETARSASENVTQYAGSLADSVAGFDLGSETGTADEAVELVQKAVAFAKENGLKALVDEVNKLNKGKLTYKDLYIGIYGFDGIIRAHGANRHFVGANTSATRDKNGKAFIADMIALGKAAGSGWVNYLFAHPVTQEVKPKASYLERLEDTIITCGCYVGE